MRDLTCDAAGIRAPAGPASTTRRHGTTARAHASPAGHCRARTWPLRAALQYHGNITADTYVTADTSLQCRRKRGGRGQLLAQHDGTQPSPHIAPKPHCASPSKLPRAATAASCAQLDALLEGSCWFATDAGGEGTVLPFLCHHRGAVLPALCQHRGAVLPVLCQHVLCGV